MTIRGTLSKSDTDTGTVSVQCCHFITCVDSCTTTIKRQKGSITQRSIREAPLTAYWGGAAKVSQPYDSGVPPGSNMHALASCFVVMNPHVPLLRSGCATHS